MNKTGYTTASFRPLVLAACGVLISLLVLATLPLLLRQTALSRDRFDPVAVRLTPLIPEKTVQDQKPHEDPQEPEPPPEPEPTPPELTEIDPLEFETPDIKPEQTAPEPIQTEPPPFIKPRFDTPSVASISLTSLPVRTSAQSLRLNLNPSRAPVPRVQTPPPVQNRFSMDEVDQKPVAVSNMRPAYPFRARRSAVEGHVKVRFLIDRSGAVQELNILEAEPEGVFERSVQKTVPRWRFKPAQKNGESVETWVMTTIRFQLEG